MNEEHPVVTITRLGMHVPIVLTGLLDPVLRTATYFWPERLLNRSWCRHFIILAVRGIWEAHAKENEEEDCDYTLLYHPHPRKHIVKTHPDG